MASATAGRRCGRTSSSGRVCRRRRWISSDRSARRPEHAFEVGLEQQRDRRRQDDRAGRQRGNGDQHGIPAAAVATGGVALNRASNFSSGISASTSACRKPATTGTIATKNAGVWYQLRTPISSGSAPSVMPSGSHQRRLAEVDPVQSEGAGDGGEQGGKGLVAEPRHGGRHHSGPGERFPGPAACRDSACRRQGRPGYNCQFSAVPAVRSRTALSRRTGKSRKYRT